MRLLVQRIAEAKVTVDGVEIGKAGPGLCLFIGVTNGDTAASAEYLAGKITALRIFEDEKGKFNRSLAEVGGEALVVSEFTLYGDCSRGRRPSFSQAAPPEEAERLYDHFIARLKDRGIKVTTGKFQTKMEVSVTNDGPVTFILER
jgi:D-aminoacyl-tRNA deacylase